MTNLKVVHDTIVVERRYPAERARVYAAFADQTQRAKWHFPGDEWVMVEMSQDFRVGGHERSRFGPKGSPTFHDVGTFLDIVPDRRIVSAGTMHDGDVRISMTLCTVELEDDPAGGTLLTLTDQSAFLDGRESPSDRSSGWGGVLKRLGDFLGAVPDLDSATKKG